MRVEPQAFGSGSVSFLAFVVDAGTVGGVRHALVAIGAVLGVALVSAGVSSAAEPVQLKSRLGDWCLDGPGNNTATVLNSCNGSSSQRWILNSVGQIESVAFPG